MFDLRGSSFLPVPRPGGRTRRFPWRNAKPRTNPEPELFSSAFENLFGRRLSQPVESALRGMLLLRRLDELCAAARRRPGSGSFPAKLLEVLDVTPAVSDDDLARIPAQGPVVAVANHPFGIVEAAILAALLPRARPDTRILANSLLAEVPELRERCIFVDPFGRKESLGFNRRAVKAAFEWVEAGGLLAVFPAGEVAHLDLRKLAVTDPEWNELVARIALRANASTLPVYFKGANGPVFHMLGLLHPRMRTILLPHEFLNKRHRRIELRIGSPVAAKRLKPLPDDAARTAYLRRRTFLLADREERPARRASRSGEPIAPAVPAERLSHEIDRLPEESRLLSCGDFDVLLAPAALIPDVLAEIGRLRETTFREAGEGTGKAADLDRFDEHYLHLWIWNRRSGEIAGAYRLGPTDVLRRRFGLKGLYTSTLFAFKDEFVERIDPALELGRSFVRLEYQREFAPLLLLWKGIGAYVCRHPRYRVLFGPVSISNAYRPASRELMVTFLERSSSCPELRPLVRARTPFRRRRFGSLAGNGEELGGDIDELSSLVGEIEAGAKGVPVLLRQYLKMGGKLLAFNVDARFSHALDGLIVVDLRQTDPKMLERYMGKEHAARFLACARAGSAPPAGGVSQPDR